MNLNIKLNNTQHLHGNEGGNLWDVGFGVELLDIIPKAYSMKEKYGRLGSIKFKSKQTDKASALEKTLLREGIDKPQAWIFYKYREYFTKLIWWRSSIKELLTLDNVKQSTLLKNELNC